jgi:hypothetical protein
MCVHPLASEQDKDRVTDVDDVMAAPPLIDTDPVGGVVSVGTQVDPEQVPAAPVDVVHDVPAALFLVLVTV